MPVTAFAGGGEGGANLSGVVAVIVDDGDAASLAAKLEAPVDSAETAEAFGNLIRVHAELMGDGDGGSGVEDVVASGNMEFEGTERAESRSDLEAGEVGRRFADCHAASRPAEKSQAGSRRSARLRR